MLKVLHNNSCSKSRCLISYLTDKKVDFEIIDILQNPLSEEEIRKILSKGISLKDLVRTSDTFFKENFSDNLSEDQLISILSETPNLIQRPIIIKGNRAIIARPMELVEDFI